MILLLRLRYRSMEWAEAPTVPPLNVVPGGHALLMSRVFIWASSVLLGDPLVGEAASGFERSRASPGRPSLRLRDKMSTCYPDALGSMLQTSQGLCCCRRCTLIALAGFVIMSFQGYLLCVNGQSIPWSCRHDSWHNHDGPWTESLPHKDSSIMNDISVSFSIAVFCGDWVHIVCVPPIWYYWLLGGFCCIWISEFHFLVEQAIWSQWNWYTSSTQSLWLMFPEDPGKDLEHL